MSPTLVNLVEDHEFISEEYYFYWYKIFWGSSKQRIYVQNGQYRATKNDITFLLFKMNIWIFPNLG